MSIQGGAVTETTCFRLRERGCMGLMVRMSLFDWKTQNRDLFL